METTAVASFTQTSDITVSDERLKRPAFLLLNELGVSDFPKSKVLETKHNSNANGKSQHHSTKSSSTK